MSTCSPTSKEARQIIEEWRIDYNTNRPHSSLNGLAPTEFAARPALGLTSNQARRSTQLTRDDIDSLKAHALDRKAQLTAG
jgi:Integrase core domain